MTVRTKQQVCAEGVTFVEDTAFISDAIVVCVLENENPIGLRSLIVRVPFVRVVLLHEHATIRRNGYPNRRDDVRVLGEQRNVFDVGMMDSRHKLRLFCRSPGSFVLRNGSDWARGSTRGRRWLRILSASCWLR